ncbi:MAG: protein-glutamate O-methyltransferase CheR [Nitrospinota bacterium]|nr:MAG: protein-glutamate O-methyltransferase CheR [Nitrospinota bacterium]
MPDTLVSPELTKRQFQQISEQVYRLCGIYLPAGKEGLVKSRLMKRLRALRLQSFDQYLHYIEQDRSGQELVAMVEVLTTNKTSFFREAQHFDYLRRYVFPTMRHPSQRVRFWSAGCSSGEEPFSLAIVLCEAFPDIAQRDIRILATDIATRMLQKAREAIYEQDVLREVPAILLQKYFTCIRYQPPRAYRLNDTVRALVRFARLNLMDPWPMKGPFDVIFCRNVMIYFDRPTQQRLVQRFWELLKPGGYLLVGHSESLSAIVHPFRYVQPAVYVK